MFDYCSLIKKKCSFAGKEKGITYCGLHTGLKIQNRIEYITSCPKKKFKKKEIVMPYHKGKKKKKKKMKKGRKK